MLDSYNTINTPDEIMFEQVKDPCSDFYSDVPGEEDEVPYRLKKAIIEAHCNKQRSHEEECAVRVEMLTLMEWYKEIHCKLQHALDMHNSNKGAQTLIINKLLFVEERASILKYAIEHHLGENIDFEKTYFERMGCSDERETHSDFVINLSTMSQQQILEILENESEDQIHANVVMDDEDVPSDDDN